MTCAVPVELRALDHPTKMTDIVSESAVADAVDVPVHVVLTLFVDPQQVCGIFSCTSL